MFYVSLVVITRKMSLEDMQNVKTNESEDITTKSHKGRQQERKGEK